MRYARALALLSIAMLAVRTARSSDDLSLLREGGQHSVDMLHAKLQDVAEGDRAALEAQLDRVCAQRDCSASRLYWYTDLEEAKGAAKRLRRPIVSLHLLGRLDEEVSCANSRFFRVLLYSDPAIASMLRDDFVLHWKSVRPVPRITIDLGNGKTIRQTITGNSAHYLLDWDGTPLDALPGLYSPREFRTQLQQWVEFHRALNPADRRSAVTAYHQRKSIQNEVRAQKLGILGTSEPLAAPKQPSAAAAAVLATSKGIIETPVLRQLAFGMRVDLPRQLDRLGGRYAATVEFSGPSLELMRRKQELTPDLLRNLRSTVAADTLFNEYELHRRIHLWFAEGQAETLEALNERVYAELFLTPSDDPWLGLQPESVFAALEE